MNHQRPSMLTAAALGGAFLGVTSALPVIGALNCVCCGLILGGGIIAAYVYLRDFPPDLPYPTYGDISLLGVFTGLIGAAVWIAIKIPMQFLMLRFAMGMREMPAEVLENPDIPEGLRRIMLELLSGGVGPFFIVATIVSSLVLSVIFATLGAIIGMALFSRRPKPLAPPSNYPPIYVPPPVPPGTASPPSEPRPAEPPRTPYDGSPETSRPPAGPDDKQGQS